MCMNLMHSSIISRTLRTEPSSSIKFGVLTSHSQQLAFTVYRTLTGIFTSTLNFILPHNLSFTLTHPIHLLLLYNISNSKIGFLQSTQSTMRVIQAFVGALFCLSVAASESAPNPIGSQYPFNVTGTLNSTISVRVP